ncbi:AQP9 / aquaporin 2 [Leishmania donovani]|uniref:Aquaporin_2_-_putative n=3 Tax=Leishmania donovani species complex TaxID=38574 RepID=A0A6L0XQZ3_LEIIN|nr:major intrisic-like protein [Leishmania infantum JPCM5]XP_003864525.1 aquaporin 9, putative [Leishmania donovani]CAC9541240.1 aquaporin_2_-_putative [Leishmania infantum]AYU82733.1 aquaporin 2, putative [Leishmania donovani]TPP40272.1 Major intrinsic family protein [Leishmania donovani]TPP46734.1 Major intrinsic family protein [Leishmania donovani]CAJ1992748.1 AQP9 / aquaporin 2 [Leishmania donovani]|eukprot:XP_001468723.1 major intrisic-like protein [Leishmania infantum JPCM5]
MLSEFLSQLVAEFVGTFLLVLTITLASVGVGTLAPIPIGFMLAAMCFTFGYISGAHFNPAISFAVFINRKMTLRRTVMYIVVQLAGSFCASLYASAIIGLQIPAPVANGDLANTWQVLLCELVYTFALTSVVLHVCFSRQRSNDFYGFAIGMTLMAAGFSVGGFTGGAFNPAVATGTQLVLCVYKNCDPLFYFWVYWIAPICGAFVASVIFQLLDTHESVPVVLGKEAVY